MKRLFTGVSLALLFLIPFSVFSQHTITGVIKSRFENLPIQGATVRLQKGEGITQTDSKGYFKLIGVDDIDTLLVSFIGFIDEVITLSNTERGETIQIYLTPSKDVLEEVIVSTGYYKTPRERATGSFAFVDNSLFNRSVSSDILSRLEDVTAGLSFIRNNQYMESDAPPEIRVQGLNTIWGTASPLIVIDNYPYEGNINNINPNDVENVTILKDAAAASIWGARAANGVIVITTKNGKYSEKLRVSGNLNVNIGDKPNLNYYQGFLPSAEIMGIEKALFDKGFYPEEDWTALPLYVEALIKHREKSLSTEELEELTARWQRTDIRSEAMEYLYQPLVNQQYQINASGGSTTHKFYFSAGLDNNRSHVKMNDNKRLTLNMKNTFRPFKALELSISGNYSRLQEYKNGLTITDLKPVNLALSPYAELKGSKGEAMAINRSLRMAYVEDAIGMGLLDWHFKPLDEINYIDNVTLGNSLRLDAGVRYELSSGLSTMLSYQYVRETIDRTNHYMGESFYVRDLVNRFTQQDGTRIIPYGDILQGSGTERGAHSGRVQLNYDNTFGKHGQLSGLAGMEIRHDQTNNLPGFALYAFDADVLISNTSFNYNMAYATLPRGTGRIPSPPNSMNRLIDRFLSYFANASYTYRDKYILSASSRWDASNIFGVKTNQKGVPLWSIGGSWLINAEHSYKITWMPYLKLRTTYGKNGNVVRGASVFPTVTYLMNYDTGLQQAQLRNAGNPGLRWEQVATWNLGLDFGLFENRIRGNVDFYTKRATDLIGNRYLDPTTGIFSNGSYYEIDNSVNYADMRNWGWDAEVTTVNLRGNVGWTTTVLVSAARNKITKYMVDDQPSIYRFLVNGNALPVMGRSRDIIYALPWKGLEKQTGNPLVEVDGKLGVDYNAYINGLTQLDLEASGISVPPYTGSIRNTLTWNRLSLSTNIAWRSGHHFRRESIAYSQLLDGNGQGHQDFFRRWQNPGDELLTDVPSMPDQPNALRDQVYLFSEALVERGDYIRLQDANLAYDFALPNPGINGRVFLYASNIGVIWRANKSHIDPEYAYARYPAPRTFALGIQLNY